MAIKNHNHAAVLTESAGTGGKKVRRWIGIDLDLTPAKSVAAKTGEEIGATFYPMVQLVKWRLAHGEAVRIFTVLPP